MTKLTNDIPLKKIERLAEVGMFLERPLARQLLTAMQENDENCRLLGMSAEIELMLRAKLESAMQQEYRLRRALWYISVNSIPPGDDWCEVPERIARWAEDALKPYEVSDAG